MVRLVTIYGGSGFLGRHIARIMAADGWRVRVAARRPYQAGIVRTYGDVSQVEPVFCNVRDDQSVAAAMAGADAVINCVGIMRRQGRNNFDSVHDEAAGRIARISAERGVKRFVHISALGADLESRSHYAASKAVGEHRVLEHRPDAVILRPSAMFGADDVLFNKLGGMMRLGPVVLLPAPRAVLQPVYVEDVARAAVMGATGEAAPGIYELGGPEVMTMREIARLVAQTTGRRRAFLGLPGFMSGLIGVSFDVVQVFSGGLITNRVLTRDQARQLRSPNRVTEGAKGLAELGISPTAVAAVIPEYLWRFRPSGQYDAIKASAKNLRHE